MAKKASVQEKITLRGFYRINLINPDGSIAGDSKWCKNQMTQDGIDQYICRAMAGMAGSKSVSHVALGTGAAPASSDTALAGEIMGSTQRLTVSPSTIASRTLQLTAAFLSANSFTTATVTLQNVGLFNSSSAGTLLAGNTYATSSCATNQSVNVTYQLRFGTA